jgi:hypothetical protein
MMRCATAGLLIAVVLIRAASLWGAAVGSYYQLDPQTRYTDVSGKLKIMVGTPFRIASLYSGLSSAPALYTMPNGDLLLTFHDDTSSDPGYVAMTSSNKGQTWTMAANPVHRFDAGGIVKNAGGAAALAAYDFQAFVKSSVSSNPAIYTATSQMGVSTNGNNAFGPIQLATFTGPPRVVPETLDGASAAPYESTSAQWTHQVNAYLWNHVLQRPDGTLIAGAYANTAYSSPGGAAKYGVYAYRSSDYGVTWDSVSTVANDPNVPGWNGYCEPTMSFTSTGDILAVMRTGDNLPLVQARSTDGGVTWQSPTATGSSGVDPDLLLMSNGILACSSGRPGNRLMFSANGTGASWTDRLRLYEYNGSNSTGYTSLAEVSPGKLLMVYDHDQLLEGVYLIVARVPEPGSMLMLILGLAVVGFRASRLHCVCPTLASKFARLVRRSAARNCP